MRRIVLFVIILLSLTTVAVAQDVVQRQFDSVGANALVDNLPNGVPMNADAGSFWDDVKELVVGVLHENRDVFKTSLNSSAILLVIVLFCAAADMLTEGIGHRAVALAGVAAILAAAVSDFRQAIAVGTDAIDEIHNFSLALIPVITGACAASGNVTASAALCSGATFFMQVLISVVKYVLVPLVYASFALAAADAALGEDRVGRLRKFLTSTVKNLLRTVMYLFGAFMSLTGILGGNADALSLKATKMVVSTMVPMVGGMVSDASETVLVGAKTVLHSVGITGLLAVLSIILVPFLRLSLHYVLLQVTSALCSVFGMKEHTALLDSLSSAVGYLMGMAVCCAIMAFVSCICFMKVSVH